jgi:hypothetical protein
MAFRSAEVNGAGQRRMAMAIPFAVFLGLACAFYIYVAIRWYLEVLMIRREAKRSSSAMARPFESAPGDNQIFGRGVGTAQPSYGGREVIVMTRSKAGEHQKRVVA